MWVRDGDGTSRDVGCCDILEAIYEEEDIATPGEFKSGSWEGCRMLGSAAVRFAMEGKGAVKDGGEDGGEGAF